jgi:hypothetical protein
MSACASYPANELREWESQSKDAPEITVVQRSIILHKHIRKKYKCKCGAAPVTAAGSLRQPGGGLYSIDFSIDVAFSRYGPHLPLEQRAIGRHDAVYYQIEPSRGHQVVVEMLHGYRGVLMVDD